MDISKFFDKKKGELITQSNEGVKLKAKISLKNWENQLNLANMKVNDGRKIT